MNIVTNPFQLKCKQLSTFQYASALDPIRVHDGHLLSSVEFHWPSFDLIDLPTKEIHVQEASLLSDVALLYWEYFSVVQYVFSDPIHPVVGQ